MIIRTKAYPRAALIGNPSDGYNGKTIAFTFSNFEAEVTLYQSPELEIIPNHRDQSLFASMRHLVEDVKMYGYYGGIRLLKATMKKFWEHCESSGIQLDDRNFTVRYRSTIPHRLGLAGSSAIIASCIRALMTFYAVEIPKPILANIILAVETEELGISAGLQDRVAMVYQGVVSMDFDKAIMERQGYGEYRSIDPALLPNLYIAYRADLAEGSEVVHNNLRARYTTGEKAVHDAMKEWAELTDRMLECLSSGDHATIAALMDRNFDLRRSITNVGKENLRMVELAREAGVSAKFTGSGGAIIGTYPSEAAYAKLVETMKANGIEVIKPTVACEGGC